LVLTGGLLALAPEFVYLLDLFGNRMNTIFKFFFQTWILWAIAGAYASAVLWRSLRGLWKGIFAASWTAIFLIGLVYPFFMLPAKADFKNQSNWTLDGFDFIQKYDQSDADIANWLKGAPFGTMVEAVGGSYSSYGTGSTFSGQSTVIQWPGHESQWRGGTVDLGARQTDVETLYRTANWADALNIIQKYNIRYIVLGPKEQAEYRATAGKFNDNLLVAYRTDTLVIYQVPDQALAVQPLKP
jgi:uncharacterized membrane protein